MLFLFDIFHSQIYDMALVTCRLFFICVTLTRCSRSTWNSFLTWCRLLLDIKTKRHGSGARLFGATQTALSLPPIVLCAGCVAFWRSTLTSFRAHCMLYTVASDNKRRLLQIISLMPLQTDKWRFSIFWLNFSLMSFLTNIDEFSEFQLSYNLMWFGH